MKALELTGKTFGKLLVQSLAGIDSRGARVWNVLCDCGNQKIMRSDIIRSKSNIGCGCGKYQTFSKEFLATQAGDYHNINNRKEYSLWRTAVLDRDKSCGRCATKNNLVAHHIVPRIDSPELVFEVSNGGTLCNSCHRKFHGKYGHTKIGLAEWKKFTWQI